MLSPYAELLAVALFRAPARVVVYWGLLRAGVSGGNSEKALYSGHCTARLGKGAWPEASKNNNPKLVFSPIFRAIFI